MSRSRLQIWKLPPTSSDIDIDINDHHNHNTNGTTTTMRINGRTMDETTILASLMTAKNDLNCNELDITDVDFDLEESEVFVQVIKSKRHWKSIRFVNCRGQINDVTMACLSSISDVTSFHYQQITNMNPTTVFAIAYGLKYSIGLKQLSLAIHLTHDVATLLAKSLARNVHLEQLSMSGSVIDSGAVGSFGFALRLNRTLKRLDLDGCHLEDKQVALILHALLDHPNLKTLSLQQNSCHDEGMGAIAAILHQDQLEELDLSYLIRKKKEMKPPTPPPEPEEENEEVKDEEEEEEKVNDEEEVKEDGSESVEETKDDDEDETKEDETNNETPDSQEEDVEDPDTQRVHNTSLKVLQLAGNGLNDNFILSLLGIFGETSSLQELNLFGNRITDRGIHMIVSKLSKLKQLTSLWLGHNPFSDHAGKELVQAMQTNFVVEEVTIRTMDNDPGKESIQVTLDHYARLNRGGRKIFSAREESVPLALWPTLLERTGRIYWGGATGNVLNDHDRAHAADAIFCLLHGPVLFSNPYLPSRMRMMKETGTSTGTATATTMSTTTTTTTTTGNGTTTTNINIDKDDADGGGGWQTKTGGGNRKRNRNKKKKGKRNF